MPLRFEWLFAVDMNSGWLVTGRTTAACMLAIAAIVKCMASLLLLINSKPVRPCARDTDRDMPFSTGCSSDLDSHATISTLASAKFCRRLIYASYTHYYSTVLRILD